MLAHLWDPSFGGTFGGTGPTAINILSLSDCCFTTVPLNVIIVYDTGLAIPRDGGFQPPKEPMLSFMRRGLRVKLRLKCGPPRVVDLPVRAGQPERQSAGNQIDVRMPHCPNEAQERKTKVRILRDYTPPNLRVIS